jgi:hypothetical protein
MPAEPTAIQSSTILRVAAAKGQIDLSAKGGKLNAGPYFLAQHRCDYARACRWIAEGKLSAKAGIGTSDPVTEARLVHDYGTKDSERYQYASIMPLLHYK